MEIMYLLMGWQSQAPLYSDTVRVLLQQMHAWCKLHNIWVWVKTLCVCCAISPSAMTTTTDDTTTHVITQALNRSTCATGVVHSSSKSRCKLSPCSGKHVRHASNFRDGCECCLTPGEPVTPLKAATSTASFKSARAEIIKTTSGVFALHSKTCHYDSREVHLFSVWYSSPAFKICCTHICCTQWMHADLCRDLFCPFLEITMWNAACASSDTLLLINSRGILAAGQGSLEPLWLFRPTYLLPWQYQMIVSQLVLKGSSNGVFVT